MTLQQNQPTPDIALMRASFDEVLQNVAAKPVQPGCEGGSEVLAHFDARRNDFDPYILEALGIALTPDELKPVSGHDQMSHVRLHKVAARTDLGGNVVVVQRSELDLGGTSESEDHSYPLLMGRVVTYSALAVAPDLYELRTSTELVEADS